MYCTQCGNSLTRDTSFCVECGASRVASADVSGTHPEVNTETQGTAPAPPYSSEPRRTASGHMRWIAAASVTIVAVVVTATVLIFSKSSTSMLLAGATSVAPKVALFPLPGPNGQWGYVNASGQFVIQPRFHEAWKFYEGLAAVSSGDDNNLSCGYIDTEGKEVVSPKFDECGFFSEGLAQVVVNERTGYIDKQGTLVVAPQFQSGTAFHDGVATVLVWRSGYAVIDRTGRYVVPSSRWTIYQDSGGLIPYSPEVGAGYGYMNLKGEVVIDPPHGTLGGCREGLCAFTDKVTKKVGFIDPSGRTIIPATFTNVGVFGEGLAAFEAEPQGKWGFIDKRGRIAIQATFDYALEFHEGLAAVKVDQRYGFIDKTGKVVISPQFAEADVFTEGLAAVGFVDEKYAMSSGQIMAGKKAYIDKTGKLIFDPQATPFLDKSWGGGEFGFNSETVTLGAFSNGLALVELGNQYYVYVDRTGAIVASASRDLRNEQEHVDSMKALKEGKDPLLRYAEELSSRIRPEMPCGAYRRPLLQIGSQPWPEAARAAQMRQIDAAFDRAAKINCVL